MPVIHLVRHGQASFGGADYDVLSPTGRQQAAVVGAALGARCPRPASLVCGTLSRQRETAALAAASAGWTGAVTGDGRWNEYDHLDILGAHAARAGATSPAFAEGVQQILEAALTGWVESGTTEGYAETWPSFTGRVRLALAEVVGELDRGDAAVVFTSAGVVAAICADLLGLPPAGFLAVNRVQANASVTTVVHGRSGTSLLTFNEHAHLAVSTVPVTYR